MPLWWQVRAQLEIVWSRYFDLGSRYFSPNYSPTTVQLPRPHSVLQNSPGQEQMRRRWWALCFSLNKAQSASERCLQQSTEHLSAGGATGLGRHPGGLVEKRSAPRGGGGGAGGRDGGRVSGTPPQPDWRHPPPTNLRRALTFGSGWEKVGWRSQEVLGAMPSELSGVSRSVKTRVLLVELVWDDLGSWTMPT